MRKLDRQWRRSALCRSMHANLDKTSHDEATGLPLHPKMVADAIKEELNVHT